jgi:ssRNA-specific RNase YbeY (16S rRNA maturation enzyme)
MLLIDSRKRESKEETLLTIVTLQDNTHSKLNCSYEKTNRCTDVSFLNAAWSIINFLI